MDESSIRRMIAELMNFGPRRGVGKLRRIFKMSDSPQGAIAAKTIIRALCAGSANWRGQFARRLRKKSSFSEPLRSAIAEHLAEPPTPADVHGKVTSTDVIRRMRQPKSNGRLEIFDSNELRFGDGVNQFIAKLHDLERQPQPIDLTIQFKVDMVYVHGLAMLAAWCDKYAANVTIKADHDRVDRYLDKTGYRKVVQDRLTIDTPLYDDENFVAITRLEREDSEGTSDMVAKRLVDLFDRHKLLDAQKSEALMIMFAELVENVYRHSGSKSPAYAMAQAFPTTRKLHFVVADTGIGIWQSFRESESDSLKLKAGSEREAIDLALQKLVTSKTSRHMGYGLFVVRRLVVRNDGLFRLLSGRTTKRFSTEKAHWGLSTRRIEEVVEHLPWQGTEVSAVFNLDNPFPLTDVYKELGPMDGHDFFGD